MAKQRMIAGYTLQQEGVVVPGAPIKCTVNVPVTGEIRSIDIDAQGNFVLFVEVWSHPEGTKINFEKREYLICGTNQAISAGNWVYYKTLGAGLALFHIFHKKSLEVVT